MGAIPAYPSPIHTTAACGPARGGEQKLLISPKCHLYGNTIIINVQHHP